MSRLAQLQADFQAYLMDEDKGAAFKNCIVDDAKVGVKRRLSIYADAYRLRIIEALANSYPKLKALLGDDLFDATARSYIDAHPSTYRNMRWVGDKMQMHLIHSLPQHPIAAEMAAFEWALGLAFDAKDTPVLQLQDLAAIPPEDWAELPLVFHPSVQWLPLKWNVLLVWQALNADETPPTPTQINEPCLVWRSESSSHYQSLDESEDKAIKLVATGATFGELCECLQSIYSEQEAMIKAAQYLSSWLNNGLMAKT
ncbi:MULTISPECIES: HvfC/BufC N-terminal domain-containing protein [Methylotenera]|uniref:HvfC/BufC N-terminal domain-containing protein n=1 Tax=Methylotenera TaxID=359407 RepID=UPI00035F7DAA|nr:MULTISPECIES: DNA-binding domain-containing protein [Methylotenera]